MRIILTVLLLCVTIFDYAQVSDNFLDGDFTSNPVWIGETAVFEVDVNNQLHLVAPSVTDTAFLVTSNVLVDNMEWTFLVNLDFNPSSSNLARVYLLSDQSDLEHSLNGYFVQIGGTADEVSLYKQTGTTISKIIDGDDDLVDSNPVSVRIKVRRTATGDWSLKADNSGNSNFIDQGTVTDNTHSISTHFGVFCKYTSSRSDKFYFDDFSIEPMIIVDTIAPQITGVEVVSGQVLLLSFSENVSAFTAENTLNYSTDNGLGSPVTAALLVSNPHIVELTYPPSFQDGVDYTITIQNVEDDSSNIMSLSTIHFTYVAPFFGAYKDIVFTEIMADPVPAVDLPVAEYLEIFNNTGETISLNNWTITDGTTTVTLNDQLFLPQTYLLCYNPQSGVDFGVFNTIEGPIPTLNNSGDVITLRDSNGLVIDSVSFSDTWYHSDQKKAGGWSLELKNVGSPCHDPSNWSASEDVSGGTPGYQNSIYSITPNTSAPKVIETFIENNNMVHFVFDKNIDGGFVSINPILNQSLNLVQSELIVTLNNFDLSQVYEITVSGFSDCWGNVMEDYPFLFAVPESVSSGDVIINEILFNPIADGSDYVEIVNISDKVLALDDLQLANIDEGIVDNIKELSSKQILFFPGDYLLLTKDSVAIIQTFPNYQTGHLLEMDLPVFNNDSGTVVLLGQSTIVLDQFSYTEDLHFALIDDLNGKALERLSFTQPTQLDDNWHTASEGAGWGTPGYLNSQTINPTFEQEVKLSQTIFSPDNDGYQDLLEITYQFDNPDNVLDIVVYNSLGRPVREIKDNFFPGQSGVIVWDGITNEGSKANVGTYIIGVTVFDLEGNVKRYKLVGVLATRL